MQYSKVQEQAAIHLDCCIHLMHLEDGDKQCSGLHIGSFYVKFFFMENDGPGWLFGVPVVNT